MDKQDMMIQQMARQADQLQRIAKWIMVYFFTMLGFTLLSGLFNLAAMMFGR